jgi:predicted HD phosphohydrolase
VSDTVTETLAALAALEGVWDEETVDELDHARQTAVRAREQRPDDDAFVVAALLHDIARSPAIASSDPDSDPDHAAVARAWLTPRYGERVGWLAGAHVAAKRHLARHDPAYALSPTSRATLAVQGGAVEVGPEWTANPWWSEALELRRCDDAAKVPGAPVPALAELRGLLARVAQG